MKLSAETQTLYLDNLAKDGKRAPASRAAGIDPTTAFRWLEASRRAAQTPDEPSPYLFEYRGETNWLHCHARSVTKATIVAIQNGALDRALNGTTTIATKDGQIVYQLNPEFEETEATRKIETDRDLVMLGYEPRWVRDENFKKVPSVIVTPPSNEIALGVLAAFSKRFSKRATIEHNHNHQGGVAVQHSLASAPRKVLEQRRDLPMLEVIPDVVHEAVADMSGVLEPGSEEPEMQVAEPAPEIAEPVAVAPAPRALSDLQRDLISRARQKGLPT